MVPVISWPKALEPNANKKTVMASRGMLKYLVMGFLSVLKKWKLKVLLRLAGDQIYTPEHEMEQDVLLLSVSFMNQNLDDSHRSDIDQKVNRLRDRKRTRLNSSHLVISYA